MVQDSHPWQAEWPSRDGAEQNKTTGPSPLHHTAIFHFSFVLLFFLIYSPLCPIVRIYFHFQTCVFVP